MMIRLMFIRSAGVLDASAAWAILSSSLMAVEIFTMGVAWLYAIVSSLAFAAVIKCVG